MHERSHPATSQPCNLTGRKQPLKKPRCDAATLSPVVLDTPCRIKHPEDDHTTAPLASMQKKYFKWKAERVFGFKPPKQSRQLCLNRCIIVVKYHVLDSDRSADTRFASTSVQQLKHTLGNSKYPPSISVNTATNDYDLSNAKRFTVYKTVHTGLCILSVPKQTSALFFRSSLDLNRNCSLETNATEIRTIYMI